MFSLYLATQALSPTQTLKLICSENVIKCYQFIKKKITIYVT